jgi:hypothetical protein
MEKIILTDRVKNEEVLHRDKEEINLPHIIPRWKANRIGHILRRDFLLKHVICRTGRGKDKSDRKTRKKTQVATR